MSLEIILETDYVAIAGCYSGALGWLCGDSILALYYASWITVINQFLPGYSPTRTQLIEMLVRGKNLVYRDKILWIGASIFKCSACNCKCCWRGCNCSRCGQWCIPEPDHIGFWVGYTYARG